MSTLGKNIWVFANWDDPGKPSLMGILHVQLVRGKEIFSFEYDAAWIRKSGTPIIDPDLQFFKGKQYLQNHKVNFGVFTDSAPDRWGRLLMRRKEAHAARLENRVERTLFENDYLLGVYDLHRMGALRFKDSLDGDFLDNDHQQASPPWTSLGTLEEISLQIEKEDAIDNPAYSQWLKILVAPGSSLGGARPKASVVDWSNHPWVAKFPSGNDDSDMGAWEKLTHQLALDAGIMMAPAELHRFTGRHHTFLSKRFDRTPDGQRLQFASALTMLGYSDGASFQDGVSYLELAEFISSYGSNVETDLEELWRRIVFHICVSNTDDHLRNHGFILNPEGWSLSPAYDINPDETGTGLKLNISETDNALDIGLAMQVLPYFRLTEKRAKEIVSSVQGSVQNWEPMAPRLGISKTEIALKRKAFTRG